MAYFYAKLDEMGHELIGSDKSGFFYNLKTLRGVQNRIKQFVNAKGKWNIYSFPGHDKVFDASSYKLIKTYEVR